MATPILEIAVFSIEAALVALNAGANRVEFCENPTEGGTTPSYGSLATLSMLTDQPVFPIIRPRGGDFLYSQHEYESMKLDVLMVKKLNYPGLVLGILKADGTIDIERTKSLVDLASPMEVTFHRAFDRCKDPLNAIEDIISAGCKRILTSGQVPHAADSLPMIKKLIQKANNRIIIMPGSGVRSNNIKETMVVTGASEMHSSARKMFPSQMHYFNEMMLEELSTTGVDAAEIKKMLEQINQKFH